jgi:hypothetical protein
MCQKELNRSLILASIRCERKVALAPLAAAMFVCVFPAWGQPATGGIIVDIPGTISGVPAPLAPPTPVAPVPGMDANRQSAPPSATGVGVGIIYDNSANVLGSVYGTNAVEFGDEVSVGSARNTITDFKFGLFLSANANGDETVQFSLYQNDGPPVTTTLSNGTTIQAQTPGTLLYVSPVLSLAGQTGYQVVDISGISVVAPSDFTWTVKFNGLGSDEEGGLLLADPPTTGTSFSDFWQRNNGTWNTYLFEGGQAANFSARIISVPELPVFGYDSLAAVVGLGCFLVNMRKRSLTAGARAPL